MCESLQNILKIMRYKNLFCFILVFPLLFKGMVVHTSLTHNSLVADSVSKATYDRNSFVFHGPVNCKTGMLQPSNPPNYVSTGFIDVSSYKFVEFTLPVSIVAGITFYDADKNVINGICSTNEWAVFVPVPEKAHYARFSQRTDIHRDYTVTLYKRDVRIRHRQIKTEYKQVFSHNEFGENALVRIPVHIITNRGTLLVACQVMKKSKDKTNNYVYLARSTDWGKSWEKRKLYDGGNPNIVYDRLNERLFVLARQSFYVSTDDGITWSDPKPLRIKMPEGWEYCYQSPTSGIQLKNGVLATVYEAFRGHGNNISANANFLVFSRDFGDTWETSDTTPEEIIANEATLAEYASNQIMINTRGGTEVDWDSPNPGRRVFIPSRKSKSSISKWGVGKWKQHISDCQLQEPICNATFISIEVKGKKYGLFCNPYTKKNPRRDLMLQYTDDFVTWHPIGLLTPPNKQVYGYCSLCYNVDKLTFVYEDIESGILFADITEHIKEILQ